MAFKDLSSYRHGLLVSFRYLARILNTRPSLNRRFSVDVMKHQLSTVCGIINTKEILRLRLNSFETSGLVRLRRSFHVHSVCRTLTDKSDGHTGSEHSKDSLHQGSNAAEGRLDCLKEDTASLAHADGLSTGETVNSECSERPKQDGVVLLTDGGISQDAKELINEDEEGRIEDVVSATSFDGLNLTDYPSLVHKERHVKAVDILPSFRLRKAQIYGILKQFYNNREVHAAAAKQNLNDQMFELAFKSFKQSIYKIVKADKSLHRVLCAICSGRGDEMKLFPYFMDHTNNMFPMLRCMDELKKISDLRGPPDLFPIARRVRRRIVYHAGPTNSGKTHAALESFHAAKSGVYCAPLRLLAAEIYQSTNEAGVKCDLLTGEERRWALSSDEPSSHVACTVEMCSTLSKCECAVIDEIQMMRDTDRGWAWTRALLGIRKRARKDLWARKVGISLPCWRSGLPCQEIHVCGEDTAVELVQRLVEACGDDMEVRKYERLGPLQILPHSIGGSLSQVQAGDCVVAFSRKELFKIRQKIERTTGQRCAMVYGGLPPATKIEQASQFNDPSDDCSILIATDAVGMGLNLNIKRIVFSAVEKFDGYTTKNLSSSQAKQIAGRAGRYGSKYSEGEVTALKKEDLKTLKNILKQPSEPVKAAGLAPSLEQIELLSLQLSDASLAHLLDVFINVVQLDGNNYFMCDLEERKFVAETIEGIPLSISEQYTFCQAPVDTNSALVSTLARKFARMVSRDEELTAPMLKYKVRWPPAMPKTVKRLQDLESLHEGLDLYLWLSYRFPHVFVDEEGVRTMQAHLENVIGAAVASNLTMGRIPRTSSAPSFDGRFSDRYAFEGFDDTGQEKYSEDGDEAETWQRIQEEMGGAQTITRGPVSIFLPPVDYERLRILVNGQRAHLRLDSGLEIPVVLKSQRASGAVRDHSVPWARKRSQDKRRKRSRR